MKIVLVTGANGFIGSFLVERLIKEGFEVRCLVRKTSDLRWIKDLPVKFCFGTLTSPETLIEPLEDVQYVFHIAAKKHAFTEIECDEVNHFGTLNLLEACKKTGSIKKFVYVSSLAVMGPNPTKEPWTEKDPCNPVSFYARSKLKGEEDVKRYNPYFPTTIIRPPAVYGPRDKDFLPLFKAIKLGLKPRLVSKEKLLSFVYVEDLASAVFKASQSEKSGGNIYFVCDPKFYSLDNFVNEISSKFKKKGLNIRIPNSIVFIVAFIMELFSRLTGKSVVLHRQMAFEITRDYWLCSPKKIEKELGIIAKTSLSEGIAKTIEWYKTNKWL